MELLIVKYLGATNTKGSRMGIKNVRTGKRVEVSKDYAVEYNTQIRQWVKENMKGKSVKGMISDKDLTYVIVE